MAVLTMSVESCVSACQEENDQLDADFHYIKRGQAVIPCHGSTLHSELRDQSVPTFHIVTSCSMFWLSGSWKSFGSEQWKSSMVEVCCSLSYWNQFDRTLDNAFMCLFLGGACEPCGSLTEVGSIIDQVSSWKILWKLSHIEVVLPGGLLLPPPEVNFGVVGIWDIPEDQAQGSSSVTLSKDVVESLWSVHTYIHSSHLTCRQTTYQVTPFALCVCVCVRFHDAVASRWWRRWWWWWWWLWWWCLCLGCHRSSSIIIGYN